MNRHTIFLSLVLTSAAVAQTPAPCEGLPPGKHSLLERFTADFGLTCDQQVKAEHMLHAEESVSKPLLAFTAFSSEEQRAAILKIKLAARRQVRTLLTPYQQRKMDIEIETVAASASKSGKKGAAKKTAQVNAYENLQTLCRAIQNYEALERAEKAALVLQVRQAALKDENLGLTEAQRKQVSEEMSKK